MTGANIAVLVLAAGGSSRMRGGDKLLEEIDGEALLRRSARAALESQARQVVVVLGSDAEGRRKVLDGLSLETITNPAWQKGMAGSIAAGLAALLPTIDGAIVMLADMPEVDGALLNSLIARFDPDSASIVRPRAASGPVGNPALFGRRHFPALLALEGDKGAKSVIAAHLGTVADVPTDSDGVLIDLDTPEAWAEWRQTREP